MSRHEKVPQPPEPPQVKRRLDLARYQLIGLPALLLLPVLAVAGTFGVTETEERVTTDLLSVSVEYTSRTRMRASHTLEVSITNTGTEALDELTVEVDRDYVDAFADASFTPSVAEVGENEYHVVLGSLPPSETRRVTVDLKPARYWLQSGYVSIMAAETEAATVEFSTFVFP